MNASFPRKGMRTKAGVVQREPITAHDLVLEKEIPTDVPGLTLTLAGGENKIDVPIVGESFRQDVIKAINTLTAGKYFQIYLICEEGNPHDKNAVGVWAGGQQVGYIAKDQAKKWNKRAADATANKQLLNGWGKCASQDGKTFGIFGYIWMPNQIAPNPNEVPISQLTDKALVAAITKAEALDDANSPETVTQLKSLAKKGVKAFLPIYG
ncbi:MAG: hypothetical protein WCI74_18950, partial [Actinomycetes bacterium]